MKILPSAIFALTITCANAGEETVARISYIEVHDRIKPFIELTSTHVNLEVRLNTDGTIQQSEGRVSGTAKGSGSANLKLGEKDRHFWKVAGPNELLNTVDYKSYKRAILVSVKGSTCTAQIDYKLKDGFTDYQYRRLKDGSDAVARSVKATNLTCSIK